VDVPKQAKIAIVVLGVLVLAWLALWLVPSWLTQYPSLGEAPARHKAAADARTGVVAFLAVLGGLGGLYYTSRTFRVGRDAQISASKYASETLRLSQETLRQSERGRITDRYSKAVEQLGDSSHEIRVGGIYALGQIMLDSAQLESSLPGGPYERPIVAVLSAFIRRTAKRKDDLSTPWPPDEAERDEVKPSFAIQAALNVLVESRPSASPPDLRDSDLRGARLRDANLNYASLRRSYLYKAKLSNAFLRHASLRSAILVEADLTGADLSDASLVDADLKGARITVDAISPGQLQFVRNRNQIIWVSTRKEHTDSTSTHEEGPDPV
jgi:Pentapeptide repeats (8 copies)